MCKKRGYSHNILSSLLLALITQAAIAKTEVMSITLPSKSGYFPVQIQNNIGTGKNNSVTNVYLLLSGEQPAAPNAQCLMQLTDLKMQGYNAWEATCQPLTMKTQASDFSYTLSALQKDSNPLIIYIPQVISGRAFVSLNYSLDIPMTRAANGTVSIQAPSLSNVSDGNYNLIFDKFEYTYDTNNDFWIDTTSVDDFSLPIALSYTDPSIQTTQLNGYTNQKRSDIINGIQTYLKKGNNNWGSLTVVDSISNTGTVMRIDAPNTSPSFNPYYFTSPHGFNYENALITYYGTAANPSNTLTIDCSEVDAPQYPEYKQLGNGTDPDAYIFKGSVVGQNFVFTNEPKYPADSMTVTVNLGSATSNDFFGPGQSPFDTPDGTVRSVIIKNFTAAASVGLLPATPGTELNDAFFEKAESSNLYYQTNSILVNPPYNAYKQISTGAGPWYNLYAQAIHKTAANPVYAFAYDDVLKQDGTIEVGNANPGDTVTPVIITLGDVGQLTVPGAGSNYQKNPAPNDIHPVTNAKKTGFSCSGTSCTLSASWTLPTYQDAQVKYFILPTPSPINPTTILASETLVDNTVAASSTTFTLPSPIPQGISQVTVYACIPSDSVQATGYDCPSEGNGYSYGSGVVGASSPAEVTLLPVTVTKNSGFTCKNSQCVLNASWTIPAQQAASSVYYIVPRSNIKASIVDIINGQQLKNTSSGTLTLPQSDVTEPAAPIVVMTCLNDIANGFYCPSSINNYNQTMAVSSAPFAPGS